MSRCFSLECLRNPSCVICCAKKDVRRTWTRAPRAQITEKYFLTCVSALALYPSLALCLPIGAQRKGREMKRLFCWCQMPSSTTHSSTHIASCSVPSDTVRKEPCRWPHYQQKSMSVECEKQTRLLSKYDEHFIFMVTQYF